MIRFGLLLFLLFVSLFVRSQDSSDTTITSALIKNSTQVDSIPVQTTKSYLSSEPDTVIYMKQSRYYLPDTIFMISGDKITGRILSYESGRLSIDAQAAGVISIKWTKIATIKGGSRIFKVEDERGEIYIGNVHASKDTGEILLISKLRYGLYLHDIVRIFPIETDWYRGFKGDLGGGISYTKSSDIWRLNTEYNIYYVVSKWRFVNNLSYIEDIENGESQALRIQFDLQALYALKHRWLLSEINSFNRNDELGIRARYSFGLGVGNNVVQNDIQRLLILTGISNNREKNTESNDFAFYVEWPVTLQHTIYSFIKPNLSSTIGAISYVGITESERYRFDASADITWEFVKNFKLSFSIYYNYDNKVIEEKKSTDDYGTVVSLLLNLR